MLNIIRFILPLSYPKPVNCWQGVALGKLCLLEHEKMRLLNEIKIGYKRRRLFKSKNRKLGKAKYRLH